MTICSRHRPTRWTEAGWRLLVWGPGFGTWLGRRAGGHLRNAEEHTAVVAYLGRISETGITRGQTNELLGLLEAAGDIEAIGDAVETNLVADGRRRLEAGIVISPSTEALIDNLASEVLTAVDIAVGAAGRGRYAAARRAIKMKPEITALTADASEHQLERLTVDEPNRVDAYRIENDIIKRSQANLLLREAGNSRRRTER